MKIEVDDDAVVIVLNRWTARSKVYAGGKQLGVISNVDVSLSMEKPVPKVSIGIAVGLSQDAVKASSESLKNSVKDTITRLQQHSYIQIESPYLGAV